jgi:multiple sugar transport system substrate-binding protein
LITLIHIKEDPMLRSYIFTIMLLAIALMGGCRHGHRDYVTVATYGDTESIAILNDEMKKLEKEQGVKVKPIYIPFNNFAQVVIADLAAGVAPDVLWVEAGFYVKLQQHQALQDLKPLILRDKLDTKAYYTGIMQRFTNSEGIYALPNDTAPVACLFYNKKMFKDVGLAYPDEHWTWNDLLNAAKKLTLRDEDGRTKVWGYQDNYGPDWLDWVLSNGGSLVDDDRHPTRCLLARPEAVEAVQFLQDLINKHHVFQPAGNRQQFGGVGTDMFITGQLAMYRSGYWVVPQLRREGKSVDWDIAPFPKGPQAKTFCWSSSGSGWAMSRNAQDKEAAWKVIKYLGGERFQGRLVKEGAIQPALRELSSSPDFIHSGKPANAKMMLWAPDKGTYAPEIKEYDEIISSIVSPRMDRIFIPNGERPEPVLKEIVVEVDKRLGEIRNAGR